MDTDETSEASLIEAHRQAKRRARTLRITFPFLIIIIVVYNVYAMAQQVDSLDTETLATETESQFHKLWPRLEEDLALVAALADEWLQRLQVLPDTSVAHHARSRRITRQ